MYDGLQKSLDLWETVPSMCSKTCLSVSADGIGGSDLRVEEVLHMQKDEDHLAVALPAVKAADMVVFVCNILVLTVVEGCTMESAFWQCIVWYLAVTLW